MGGERIHPPVGKISRAILRWLLENIVGYTLYFIKQTEQEEAAGVLMSEGHRKASLLSFVTYACGSQGIQSLLGYKFAALNTTSDESPILVFLSCSCSCVVSMCLILYPGISLFLYFMQWLNGYQPNYFLE